MSENRIPALSPARYFEALKRYLEVPRWEMVAEMVGVSSEWIRVIRRKDSPAGQDVAIRIADLMNLPRARVVYDFEIHAAMAADRFAAAEMWRDARFKISDEGIDPKLAKVLREVHDTAREDFLKKIASAAMGVLILIGLFGPPPANATTGAGLANFAASSLYIMSNAIRFTRRKLRRIRSHPIWAMTFRLPLQSPPSIC